LQLTGIGDGTLLLAALLAAPKAAVVAGPVSRQLLGDAWKELLALTRQSRRAYSKRAAT